MIKTYSEFISKAKEKFGENTFTYLKDTFTFYTKPMTIIHNDSGLKFEMTPEMHIKSKTGISKDVIYKLKEPFDDFYMLASLYYSTYEPIEETYRGYSRAVVVEDIDTCKRYYVKAGDLVHPRKHVEFIPVDEVERMKEVISKYKKRVDFYADEPELNEKIKKNGLYFLLDGLDWKPDRLEYSEEYLRNHLLEYKNAGKSRSMFVKENSREHSYIRRHNLIHLYYECGLTAASELQQGIYACEFRLTDGNYAYIGLTYNFSEREADHRGADPQSTPCKFIKEHNLDKNDMIFKILLDIDDCKNPSEMEEYYRQKYEKEGWIILNSAPTGARGHRHIIVESREDVEKFVKEHNITSASRLYHDSRDMYRYAEKNGFLAEVVNVNIIKTTEDYDIEFEESLNNNNLKSYTEWYDNYTSLWRHLRKFDKNKLDIIKKHFEKIETEQNKIKEEQFIKDLDESIKRYTEYRKWCDNERLLYRHLLKTNRHKLREIQNYYNAGHDPIAVCNIFDDNRVLFVLKSISDIQKYSIARNVVQKSLKTEHKTYNSYIKFKTITPEQYEQYKDAGYENISVDDFFNYKDFFLDVFGGLFCSYEYLFPVIEYDLFSNKELGLFVNTIRCGFHTTYLFRKYSKDEIYLKEFVYQKRRFKSISIEEMYRILAERNPELTTLGNYFPC